MSGNRMHEPGAFHMLTNRCQEGMFLLRPTKEVTELIQYWFARAMALYGAGLEVYAFVFLSNHFHILLRDNGGSIAEFMDYFQGNLARALNEHYGRKNAVVWPNHYDDQIIEGERTLWKKFLYILANPVKSALVMRTSEWGGFNSLRACLTGDSLSFTGVNRTRYHNASRGKKKPPREEFEETYTFELSPLPMLKGLSRDERQQEIKKQLVEAERHYRGRWKAKKPLGMKAARSMSWRTCAPPPEPRPRQRFACDCPDRKKELEEIYKRLVGLYKETFAGFRRSVELRRAFHGEWPPGSYPPSCHIAMTAA